MSILASIDNASQTYFYAMGCDQGLRWPIISDSLLLQVSSGLTWNKLIWHVRYIWCQVWLPITSWLTQISVVGMRLHFLSFFKISSPSLRRRFLFKFSFHMIHVHWLIDLGFPVIPSTICFSIHRMGMASQVISHE